MQARTMLHTLAVLALFGLGHPIHATTVIQPTFDQLVGSADYVVRVTVKSIDSDWRENPAQPGQKYIGSRITLDVKEVVSGNPPQPLVLDIVGGKVGKQELLIEGTPRLTVGQECILFVRGNGQVFYPVVGLNHGYFPVRRDAVTGEAQVLRANGRLLYDVRELEPGAVAAVHGPADRPLSPAAFSSLVQQRQRDVSTREKQR